MIFADEAGFYVLPAVVRTWAPSGETPTLKAPLLWEHLSVIGGITPEGKLYQMRFDHAIRSADVVRFLRHLLRQVEGRMTVVWDGLPAHRSKVVKGFLAEEADRRIHLERLPGYAPDLNPKEGIWHYLKGVELKNLCCSGLQHLRVELRKAKERLRHKTHVIKGCFRQVGLV